MKKTVVKPDGTQEVLEGTPDEIAELERKLRGGVQEQVKKPGLLTEDKLFTQEFLDKVLEEIRKNPVYAPQTIPFFETPFKIGYPRFDHDPSCDIVTAQRGWWSVVPPRCTCGLVAYPIPGSKFTFTTTTTLTCPDCGMATMGLNSSSGLCNCARGADGKVLETSNVEARKAHRELLESIDRIKVTHTSGYIQQTLGGKLF